MGLALNALAGLLFGLGLVISGMVNPAKVLNFLDPFGTFDPSLAFVMLGAVLVTFVGYGSPFVGHARSWRIVFVCLLTKHIDARVVIGPAIFGVGWGLSGF